MSVTKSHSILIVDDEPDVLFSLSGLLRRDFQVFTAESGAAALEILRDHPVQVIMTDQRMPTMTGVELMQRVRTEHPEAIRIVFTGYADARAVMDAINTGELYRYISKPWDPEDLIELLRQAAQKYDETVAQCELLLKLDDYFDDASRLAATTNSPEFDAAFLESFRSRTEQLRQYTQTVRTSI